MQIGKMLIIEGLITEDQLKEALVIQKNNPDKMIGEVFIELDYISIEDFITVLGRQIREKESNKFKSGKV